MYFVDPPALTVSIIKNTENSSIIVQWDEVDDSLITTYYVVAWTSERDHITHPVTLTEQSSYTITGLTLDTVYTVIVTAANRCGPGPEYRTSVSLATDITSTVSSAATLSMTSTTSIDITTTTTSSSITTTTILMTISSITTTNSLTTTVSRIATTTTNLHATFTTTTVKDTSIANNLCMYIRTQNT